MNWFQIKPNNWVCNGKGFDLLFIEADDDIGYNSDVYNTGKKTHLHSGSTIEEMKTKTQEKYEERFSSHHNG